MHYTLSFRNVFRLLDVSSFPIFGDDRFCTKHAFPDSRGEKGSTVDEKSLSTFWQAVPASPI